MPPLQRCMAGASAEASNGPTCRRWRGTALAVCASAAALAAPALQGHLGPDFLGAGALMGVLNALLAWPETRPLVLETTQGRAALRQAYETLLVRTFLCAAVI